MNNPENNKWLDKILGQTIGSEKIKPDFEQWKQNHPRAVETLTSRASDTQVSKRSIKIKEIIMKNSFTKFASAAVIIIAVMLSIIFTGWPATPAWAIEQTIDALNNMKMVHFSGYAKYQGRPKEVFEIWAMPNSSDPSASGYFKLIEGDSHIAIANEKENLTYVFTKLTEGNVLYITEGLNRTCNPFPSGDLFRYFKQIGENWKETYTKDEKTGRESVFVTLIGPAVDTACYWKLEFDVETKMPVRAGVWWNENYEGEPHFDYTAFDYSVEAPEELFQFEIPQDTQIIDCRQLRRLLDENPNFGIPVEDMDFSDACKQIVQEYWQAVIDNNWDLVQKIRPLATGNNLEQLKELYQENEPLELSNISGMNHLNDPGTFAEVTCLVKTKNGATKKSVLNVEQRQTPHGRIGVIAGSLGDELADSN